jgi:hypothetical protein
MATPTITNVSPATGPAAGGNLVTLTGTNFKIPVLDFSIPTPAITPTVAVTVGGRAARRVDVISATEVRVLMPRLWHADPETDSYSASDIVLTNLDENGDPISGESVTETGGYTYERWALGPPRADPPMLKILRELIWALKLEVERNVYRTVHMDYAEDEAAVVIDHAKLPSINIILNMPKDVEYSQWDNYPEEVDIDADTAAVYEGAITKMLQLNLYLSGEGSREATALTSSVEEWVQVNPELHVEADQDLYPGEEDDYPVEISRFPQSMNSPNESNVVSFSMQLQVRGIAVLPTEPTYIAKKINEFIMTLTDTAGNNPAHMTI